MTRDKLKSYINQEYVQKGLGIVDADDSELQLIVDRPRVASYYFANMISRRAQSAGLRTAIGCRREHLREQSDLMI